MFGTMIIILPSQYAGGNVDLSHSSETKTFDFASSSLASTSVLGWYTDVTHQVNPVTNGYRLALSFNLIHANSAILPSLPDMTESVHALRQVLRKWKKECYEEDVEFLAYILDHKYSEVELSSGAGCLKGKDAHKLGYLRPQTWQQGYKIWLGNLSCRISGYTDDDGYGYNKCHRYGGYDEYSDEDDEEVPTMSEETDRDYSIKHLVDVHGKLLLEKGHSFSVYSDNIVPEDYFEGQDPDDEEYEGYTGNVLSVHSLGFPHNLTV